MSKRKPVSSRRPSTLPLPAETHPHVVAPAPIAAKPLVLTAPVALKPASVAPPAPAATAKFTDEERRRMIARLAFSIAERASFQTDPFNDWVTAEREVDRQLSAKN